MEIRTRNKDALLRRFLGPKLMRVREKSPCQHWKEFPSLWRFFIIDYVIRRLYHVWCAQNNDVMRKKIPRFGLATCLRKEHSGSFNVLNYWICQPCKNHMRVKKSHHEILEPTGLMLGLEIDSMDSLRDFPHARTLVKAVVANMRFHLIDYPIRGKGRSLTCNPELSWNSLSHSKRCQKRWEMKLKREN